MSYEAWRYAAEEVTAEAAKEFSDVFKLANRAALEAPSRAEWDCQRGCAHCCHLLVEITAAEAEALSRIVTPVIRARIESAANRVAGLGPAQYRALQQPCAFLGQDGECLAYDVRPLRCRAHVSTSEPVCRRVFDGDPSTPSGSVPGDVWLATVIEAIQAGVAPETKELHTTLAGSARSDSAVI